MTQYVYNFENRVAIDVRNLSDFDIERIVKTYNKALTDRIHSINEENLITAGELLKTHFPEYLL